MKHNISYLFLRGLSRNQFHWKNRDVYEKNLENECHFLDLPGFGTNAKFSSPKDIELITDNLKSQWDKLKNLDTQSKKVIVGLSLGGVVSLDWVSRFEDWDGLVMINSSVSDLSTPFQRLQPKNYFKILSYLMTSNPNKIEQIIFDMTCASTEVKNQMVQDWVEIRKKYPSRNRDVLNQLKAVAAYKSPEKSKIKIPGMVLSSAKDQLVNPKCSLAIAEKFKFDLRISEKAGHDMCVDDHLWMLDQIKNFSESALSSLL